MSQRDIKTWERRILAHLCRTAQRKRFRVAGLTVILDLILVINGAAFLRRQFCEKKVICCATLTKMWPIKLQILFGGIPDADANAIPKNASRYAICPRRYANENQKRQKMRPCPDADEIANRPVGM